MWPERAIIAGSRQPSVHTVMEGLMSAPPQFSPPATDDIDRCFSPVRTAAHARGTVRLRDAWATWISKVRALVSGTDQDSVGEIEAPHQETATIVAPETVTEAKPRQVASIDHIDPADLMRLDPNQLDHDPVLKA